MTKRIMAFAAAVLMAASVFTGCGSKTEDDAQAQTSVNVIENGTTAPSGEEVTTAEGDFSDPAAQLGVETQPGDVPPEDAENQETTLPQPRRDHQHDPERRRYSHHQGSHSQGVQR
ncbi:MAG: hypothetical protein L6V87_09615 [Ruminococcus sp.]|nr:MAG: hypothetical protein L6V87_09615 [Ruminococcus sp.]